METLAGLGKPDVSTDMSCGLRRPWYWPAVFLWALFVQAPMTLRESARDIYDDWANRT